VCNTEEATAALRLAADNARFLPAEKAAGSAAHSRSLDEDAAGAFDQVKMKS
jgi:hypothetical protein